MDANPIPGIYDERKRTMKIATVAQRLNEILKIRGMTAAELGRLSSVSGSTICEYCKGVYEPSYERTMLFADILECSPQWLRGEDTPMTEEEMHILAGTVPLLRQTINNPDDLLAAENIAGQEFAEKEYCDGNHFMLIASGDQMEPMIYAGDRLLCVKQDTLEPDRPGVFMLHDGRLIISRLKYTETGPMLVGFNRHYPPRSLELFGSVKVVGRVVRSCHLW